MFSRLPQMHSLVVFATCLFVSLAPSESFGQFPGGSGIGGGGVPRSPSSPGGGFNRTPGRGTNPRNNFGRSNNFNRNPSYPGSRNNYPNSRTPSNRYRPGNNIPGSNFNNSPNSPNRYQPNTGNRFGSFNNPFRSPSAQPTGIPGRQNSFGRTHFNPSHVNHVNIHSGGIGSNDPFRNIRSHQQPAQMRKQIDDLLNKQKNLNNLLHATNAAHRHGLGNDIHSKYRSQAMTMARSQIQSGSKDSLPYVAMAKFSLEDSDMTQFRSYTRQLEQKFPGHKHTHFFKGIEHLDNKDWKAAERELRAARKAGIPEEDLAGYLKMAIDNQKWIWEYAMITASLIGVWLLGMGFLYVMGLILSKSTLETIKSDPNVDMSRQRTKNRFYRFVVFAAGIYYYISLPMVVLCSIALPAALIYAALSLHVISWPVIGLVLFGSVGGVITATSGLRASFISIPKPQGERKLTREEAPGLWEVAYEVAEKVGTRPVDEICLSADAELSVTERGSLFQKMRNKGKRILFLGTGAIDKMDQGAFRAILAHEYGHFQNRDTAGGDIAMRVYVSMEMFRYKIIERGKIRWWDIAVRFLSFYVTMYQRISFGASRLHEVLADRVAVKAYGAAAFKRGLEHAIRRDLEVSMLLNQKISRSMMGEDPADSLEKDRFSPFVREQISKFYEDALKETTTEFDSHPSPTERFAMTAKLNEQGQEKDANRSVWDLFARPVSLQKEMDRELDRFINEETQTQKKISVEAIRFLTRIIQQTREPIFLIERAQIYTETGNIPSAINDLLSAQKRGIRDPELTLMLAKLQRRIEKYDDAIVSFNSALSMPNQLKGDEAKEFQFQCNLGLGQSHQLKNNLEMARQYFDRAATINDNSYGLEVYRARLELATGNANAAMRHFNTATNICKDAADPYYYRGMILEKHGKNDDALKQFDAACRLDRFDKRFFEARTRVSDN